MFGKKEFWSTNIYINCSIYIIPCEHAHTPAQHAVQPSYCLVGKFVQKSQVIDREVEVQKVKDYQNCTQTKKKKKKRERHARNPDVTPGDHASTAPLFFSFVQGEGDQERSSNPCPTETALPLFWCWTGCHIVAQTASIYSGMGRCFSFLGGRGKGGLHADSERPLHFCLLSIFFEGTLPPPFSPAWFIHHCCQGYLHAIWLILAI